MSGLGNFIWGIADQLRGVYKPAQYGTATLPFLILRRMECVLDEHRDDVDALVAKLQPVTAAGSAKKHDPRLVLMDELIKRLNEQFAGEDFGTHQVESWVRALIEAMKTDPVLQAQAAVNSQDQFLSSKTLKDNLLIAVAETDAAQSRMAELFNSKGAIEQSMLALIGELLYLDLNEGD